MLSARLSIRAISLAKTRTPGLKKRFITLGRGYSDRLLLVVWTERGEDVTRIISARKASPGEARAYKDGVMRKEYDFGEAKQAKDVPHLKKLQSDNAGKERITIRLDAEILNWFREQVKGGGNYQTLINEALHAHIAEREGALERTLRRVLREELKERAA